VRRCLSVHDDCETQYYTGNIHAELSAWAPTAEVFTTTAACLERAREALRKEIGEIGTSSLTPERKARQIARREAQIESAGRMLATSWFNTAAAHFNLGRRSDARTFAERVANDERFGERARELLERLTP
jgi:hypothetical protein